jgi:hypothetical protein
MLSKYVLNSNWSSLSSNYKFDNNVDLFNVDLTLTGNLNLTYTPYLSNLRDVANNNYSYLFLTKKNKINNIFNNKLPTLDTNKQVCLLANKIENYLVSEDTTFLKINPNGLGINNIIELSDDNFFEVDFVSSNEVIVVSVKERISYYVCIDDITTQISIIQKNETQEPTDFELEKIKLFYIFDNKNNGIILYKIIQNKVFVISIGLNNEIVLRESTLLDLNSNDIFVLLKLRDLPELKNNLSWVTYKKNVNEDSLDISNSFDVNNNFIAHFEYETLKNTSISTNFLTLKNQLNIRDNSVYNDSDFRDYNSLITGGNREEGYKNINISYSSEYYTQTFAADKTTWFHVPYNNSGYRPNINSVPFFKNGAIAGNAPIYSDKIFKKAANYATTSNMGTTLDNEETGIWLCSWLSGGKDNAVWVDRFYNTSSFTPYEALKYSSNVTYSPEYLNKYKEGVSDVVSRITLEPGAWYAYSRFGKSTATNILSGLTETTISTRFDSFRSSSKLERPIESDKDGQVMYNFDGNSYGIISTDKLNYYNNFNISFFATRNFWNINKEYQIFGNYIDSGFGLFNNNYVNPINFYINGEIIYILNNKYDRILTVDVGFYLQNSSFDIAGVFRKEFNGNFHVITSHNYLLEFNTNGTLVDLLSVQKTGSNKILNVSNNSKYGVVYYEDGTALRVNLFSNAIENITNSLIITKPTNSNPTIVIDSFDYVYIVDGKTPILKGSNLYYRNIENNTVEVYNLNTTTINTYISSNEPIFGYNFDKGQNTYVILKNTVNYYNTLGEYVSSKKLSTGNLQITAFDIGFQNLNDKQQGNIRFIDSSNNNYCYNLNSDTYKKIDSAANFNYSLSSNVYKYNFDFSNYNFIQSIISNQFPLPGYNFKLRLFNQFNYEDVKILNTNILGQNLNTGTHHFSINLNTLKGFYEFYIDGILYNRQTFEPAKYSFASLFKNSVIFGSIPFYGGLLYSDFYKSDDLNTFVDDIKIEKFKFYKDSLNVDEIKLLYFEKFPPKDLVVDLNIGSRNYIDTITRTFKHKMQGSKSNLINLVINDSLINDAQVQKRYEMLILKKLQTVLPGYVKINSIKWANNKDNSEKMLVGNFNVRNTLTNNIE